jgi:hypothetical protein
MRTNNFAALALCVLLGFLGGGALCLSQSDRILANQCRDLGYAQILVDGKYQRLECASTIQPKE